MDFTESTKIVYGRIQKLEPENASKIVGFLLLQDNSNREMIRLAFSPENVILCIINNVKTELGLISPMQPSFLLDPYSYWSSLFPPPDHNLNFQNPSNGDSIPQDYLRLPNEMQLLNLDADTGFSCNNRYNPARLPGQGSGPAEFPSKICHYFANGFCKNGSSCRFLHENPNDGANEDTLFSPRSLDRLEGELTELLRSRNGVPISIATLPLVYYDKYGKSLQADGYLTESQRHGKAGYSLTRLLDRMRPSIRLIASRAHGQHSVILAEDLPKYLDYGNELAEHGGRPMAARQIYLTFPAESSFTEEDVSNHFNLYGPVLDVRLPSQQKRMFGFVTFVYPETVNMILAKGNPHFIGGARILVKPYKEHPRAAERRIAERRQSTYFGMPFVDGDSNPQLVPRTLFDTRHVRKNLVEEEGELELERRRLSEFQLFPKQVASPRGNGYSTAGLKLKEAYGEQADFQDPERFSFLFNTLSDGSTSEERARCSNSNQGLNFPESPFADSIAERMSTVM